MRKPVQILFSPTKDTLYALCDDGSIWHQEWVKVGIGEALSWIKDPCIPQESGGEREAKQ